MTEKVNYSREKNACYDAQNKDEKANDLVY